MSEAWHQHLAHLSWWEQIDRFFNPGKYSCSVYINDGVYHIFLAALCIALVSAILLAIYLHFNGDGK
jgi:hypothetical protein